MKKIFRKKPHECQMSAKSDNFFFFFNTKRKKNTKLPWSISATLILSYQALYITK